MSRALAATPAHDEKQPHPSPAARWLAYASDESSQFQVYVRPLGEDGPRFASPATAGISRAGLPTDDRGRRPSRSRSPRSSTRASAPRTPRCRSPAGIASSPSRSGTRRSTNREGTPRSSCFTSEEAFQPPEGAHGAELIELMSLSQEEFSRRFKNSPVERAKRRGLLRNVAVAALGRTRIRGGRTRRWPATGI
jgi:hypothetical protein